MITKWHKCYDSGWKGVIVPEAFSHPAKMSYGLLKRILEHARDEKWIRPRDIVVDPFGGIGSTGIVGAYADLRVICVELEPKFVKLAEQNFELHDNAWQKFGNPRPIILQGDSRRLCEVVEKADVIISSPPYAESDIKFGHEYKAHQNVRRECKKFVEYGKAPGQLGSMKPGKVDMVVSSPPFQGAHQGAVDSSSLNKGACKRPWLDKATANDGYGNSPSNLGNLKSGDVDCVISSPPYEGSLQSGCPESKWKLTQQCIRDGKGHASKKLAPSVGVDYGNSEGQLGADKGNTFWQAAKTIVEQCFQILKPGGHAIWVVKSFVRNKKIVDFPGDWQRLCESVGFKTVCVHHAMLVKETTHKTLFGDTEVKRTERKSFFRRLAESKGSPRIDFEVVLCMAKQPLFPVETKKG